MTDPNETDEPTGERAGRPPMPRAGMAPTDAGSVELVEWLTLDPLGGDVFRGHNPPREGRVFGGSVLAHALGAAQMTVGASRGGSVPTAHALHGHFVEGGLPGEPSEYRVERVRDGASFATRQVTATQDGRVIFVASVSFHADEAGPDWQLDAPADVPDPSECELGRYASDVVEVRDVPFRLGTARPYARRMWFRTRRPLPDDPAMWQRVIVFASDHGSTRAVRTPHRGLPGLAQRQSVSLDHAIWFHRPARPDEWMLTEVAPISTGNGRGLATGTIHTRTGTLVATFTQEALFRIPPDAT